MTKPNFICIGPAKSATTWLADHLKLQTDMWFPPIQEISYPFLGFSHFEGSDALTMKYDWWSIVKRGVRNKSVFGARDRRFYQLASELARIDPTGEDFNGYKQIFGISDDKITGDISPIYSSFSSEQIETLEANTECGVVFMFARDPVARFWSHFRMVARYKKYGDINYSDLDVVQKFAADPLRSKQFFQSQIHAKWKKVYGPDRFSVFFFEDVLDAPKETLEKIILLVGASPKARLPFIPHTINRNSASTPLEMSPEVKQFVTEYFKPELEACVDLFGAKGEKWLKRWASSH